MDTKVTLLKKLSAGQLSESESVEFKEKWQREHGYSISAIGNNDTGGGWLIVGVNDKGLLVCQSQEKIKKQQQQIEAHIDQFLDPYVTVKSISIEVINNKHCLLIEIINPNKRVSWNHESYHRIGSRTIKMSQGQKKDMDLNRPGLDFSSFNYNKSINSGLVLDFAQFLKNDNVYWTKITANNVLSKLNIKNKNVSGILFGEFTFRLIHYNENSEILDQQETENLYRLLQEGCIQHIQSWTREIPLTLKPGSLSVMEEKPYPDLVLRELLVNAVAHSTFEKQGIGVEVHLFKNRIVISNPCSATAEAFINKRFSVDHFSHNPLLIKILRKAQFSEELGSGKSKIFKTMIESGKKEPLFEYKKLSDDYGVWSVTLYNEQPDKNFLKLLKRFKSLYLDNPDKYKISAALVLWKDKTLKEILHYMDEYHKKLTGEILSDEHSPFLLKFDYSKKNKKQSSAKILLKRWVQVQLEGQDSRVFSPAEEYTFKEVLRDYAYRDNRRGYVTNKDARRLFGLSDSQSEIVQLSKMFQHWEKTGFMKREKKRGYWKIIHKPKQFQKTLFKNLFDRYMKEEKK